MEVENSVVVCWLTIVVVYGTLTTRVLTIVRSTAEVDALEVEESIDPTARLIRAAYPIESVVPVTLLYNSQEFTLTVSATHASLF